MSCLVIQNCDHMTISKLNSTEANKDNSVGDHSSYFHTKHTYISYILFFGNFHILKFNIHFTHKYF